MSRLSEALPRLGTLLLLLFVLYSIEQTIESAVHSVVTVRQEIESNAHIPTVGYVRQVDRQFDQIKPALSELMSSYGPIGYVSDEPPRHPIPNLKFAVVRSAMTPYIVDRGADCCQYVIGRFENSRTVHPDYGETELVIIQEFEGGVVLFLNEGR